MDARSRSLAQPVPSDTAFAGLPSCPAKRGHCSSVCARVSCRPTLGARLTSMAAPACCGPQKLLVLAATPGRSSSRQHGSRSRWSLHADCFDLVVDDRAKQAAPAQPLRLLLSHAPSGSRREERWRHSERDTGRHWRPVLHQPIYTGAARPPYPRRVFFCPCASLGFFRSACQFFNCHRHLPNPPNLHPDQLFSSSSTVCLLSSSPVLMHVQPEASPNPHLCLACAPSPTSASAAPAAPDYCNPPPVPVRVGRTAPPPASSALIRAPRT